MRALLMIKNRRQEKYSPIAGFSFYVTISLETCSHHFLAQLVDVIKDGVSALG